MTAIDIHAVLRNLARKRPVFHSEADFQFALAWEIREETGLDVRLEFPPRPGTTMHLDIWLPEVRVAIELKYFKKQLDVELNGERFALPNQGAHDIHRYHYVQDIQRVEAAGGGFAVALTNDPTYWTAGAKAHPIDAAFRLHEGRTLPAGNKLAWARGCATGRGRASVVLEHPYQLQWRDYGRPVKAAADSGQFRYLAVEVSRRGRSSPAPGGQDRPGDHVAGEKPGVPASPRRVAAASSSGDQSPDSTCEGDFPPSGVRGRLNQRRTPISS